MENTFRNYLVHSGFHDEDIEALLAIATPLDLPTRHILSHQGEVASHIYFILEGICHASYLTDKGKSFSKEFYWESDWIIGFESLIKREPLPYLLETLSPVKLMCLPISVLFQWHASRHPAYIKLLETKLIHKENKERLMLLYTPEERYQLFRQHYPQLLERLADYHVAAYLGITPISLSRIKKRVDTLSENSNFGHC
ncbi:Cyclic nucleotide-binding domain protein [Vibrio ruber DSM 16370]|uniref:Cyclic nucleotide-binding domain protein n=1 Tax=Vibrio ruber (strain DSM 16370 / JCM 11486 / BCRC 17186 / CECT 7878 / LMG 23124 / VR1) TaxID=1123498 RepID=A0A1R4LM08_VIBR1|nr:Crp/Fnr family transcriptional regulator [Vibrio ruber]SJN57636.1 Cyclic nucleotide-binding domain protein [Vibrio ruber DSM 16370]